MRKLLWFAIGFGAACGYCAYLNPDSLVLPMILLGILAIFAGRFLGRLTPAEMVCYGCVLGLVWFGLFRQYYLTPSILVDGLETEATVTVTDYGWKTDYGIAADGWVNLEDKPYRIRMYGSETASLSPGDTISAVFRMRYTPGGEENATYHPGEGIFLLGYQKGEGEISRENSGANGYFPARLAHWIKTRLRILLPADVRPFAKALLLGDGSDLSYEIDTAFQVSGIRHIIAVSGLHVMLLYTLLSTVTFQNKWLTALLCLPVLTVFAAVAGFTPSVTRASIMVALMILARIFNREYDPATALSFSALVMLLVNPMVITAVSFQLTVGCVAGIQLFSKPIREWLKWKLKEGKGGFVNHLKRWFSSSVSITLGAMSLTTPLCAYYFGTISLVGVITNLLTLWLVNLVFNGLIVLILVSLFSLKFASLLAGLLSFPIRFVLNVAMVLGNLPLAAVYTVSPYITAWLVFVYLLLIVFLFSFRRKPGQLVLCITLDLCLAIFASWMEPRLDACRVNMLDVGQGQCILLQNQGANYLIDCGGDSDTETADRAAQLLLSQGIRKLDGIILTHWDRDHAGGLPYLLSRVEADQIYGPEPETQTVAGIWVSSTMEIPLGEAKISLFPGEYGEDDNENSICVLFESENCDILVTGDRSGLGELLLMQQTQLPRVDLLVAGHHGSKHATSEELLETVRPHTVLISAGEDNSFGHPARETLQRLEQFGCRVYRTDLHGTIIFRR